MNKMQNRRQNPTTEGISYHIAENGKSWSYKDGKLHPGVTSFYSSLGSSCSAASSPLLLRVLAYPALRTDVISGPQLPSPYTGLCARSMATFTRT